MNTNPHRDQKIIEDFIQKETTLLNQFTTDEDFFAFFVDTLVSLKQNYTLIVTVTGGPGSGKSTFVKNVISKLNNKQIVADSITTEDFNLLDRKTRDDLISCGANPLDFKDFTHLNKLVEKVKKGEAVRAPQYDRITGTAIHAKEEYPHDIAKNLNFLFIDGDFQPVENPDLKIYFHVPTEVRRKNRIKRDLEKHALKTEEEVSESFNFRLESQYYPYTFPHHKFADLVVTVSAKEVKNGEYIFTYFYKIHKRS